MLLSFRVANHKSIRDEVVLSFVRSRRMARSTSAEFAGFLPNPVTGIYGANASGKSNLLDGLDFVSTAVHSSFSDWEPGHGVPRHPFLLDEESVGTPTLFEIGFLLDGVLYEYGFEVDTARVQREWLYAYPRRRRQVWLERDASEQPQFHFGGNLAGPNKAVANLTRANALFLSTAHSTGHSQLEPVAAWIGHSIRFAHSRNERARLTHTCRTLREQEDLRSRVIKLLTAADLGIHDIKVQSHEFSPEERGRLARALRELRGDTDEDEDVDFDDVLEGLVEPELQHAAGGGRLVGLPFEAESQGTRALLALAKPVFDSLDSGHVLLVDEIDTSLHPELLNAVVGLFQDPATNRSGGQLVFTAHETRLLDTVMGDESLLERDQVWHTQKDGTGCTDLTPFSDFQLRKDENLRRLYLQGRLGGMPVLYPEDFREVGDWETRDTGEPELEGPSKPPAGRAPNPEALSRRR